MKDVRGQSDEILHLYSTQSVRVPRAPLKKLLKLVTIFLIKIVLIFEHLSIVICIENTLRHYLSRISNFVFV
jgi:hypothetical protein